MSDPGWLRLDENLILRAGAGTGKTHALITLAMSLLSGLRRGPAVEPHRLWILTFTEQAAAELRVRLRERLLPLGEGESLAAREPELWAVAEALGKGAPSPARWQALSEAVGEVHASTLHGAGAALLREHGGAGLSGFEVLEEEGARALLAQAAQEVILGDPQALGLLEDLGFRGAHEHQTGLVEALRQVHQRLAEDGVRLAPEGLPRSPDLAAALRDCGERFLVAGEALVLPEVQRAGRLLLDLPPDDLVGSAERFWPELNAARTLLKYKRKGGADLAREAFDGLGLAFGAARAAMHAPAFQALLGRVQGCYAAAKARRGALDFSDLCNQARDLLRDDVAARRAAKAQVGALLLDETQDTSRVQLELCLLLAEERAREAVLDPARRLAPQLTLETGTLAAVGDRKQSIYEFRGANVAVFEELAEALTSGGGRAEVLSVSRRSRPALVGFVNRFFAEVMKEGGPGAMGFGADDALGAHRAESSLPAAVLLSLSPAVADGGLPGDARVIQPASSPVPAQLAKASPKAAQESAESLRGREAKAVAARVATLLRAPPAALREAVAGGLAPGHVALLFRRQTHVEVFRAALAEAGVPSVLLGGDGFWEQPEVLDATALLSVLLDPADGVSALTLLRSPLCGVTDSTVARLVFAARARKERGLSLRWLWAKPLPQTIPAAERALLAQLGALLRGLMASMPSLGAGGVLREAEVQLGLRARYGSDEASANLNKLQRRLTAWQAAGWSFVATARRLQLLTVERPREAVASAAEGTDKAAVRLLTIHAAKGLEFPVVFVVECGAGVRHEDSPVLYDRDLGLALKGRDLDGNFQKPAEYAGIQEAIERRSRAEVVRLLYVAATRAQELLFFTGELPRTGGKDSWRSLVDQYGPAAGLQIEHVTGAEGFPPPGLPLEEAPTEVESRTAAAAILAETAPLPRLLPTRLPLAASAAADLGLCQRRFQLRQLWQMPERRNQRELPEDLPSGDDPRALGSLAHRLLELVDLPAAALDLDAALSAAAARVSPLPGADVPADVLAEVRAVLASDLGTLMRGLPPARVLREVPFVLRLGDAPVLVAAGSIDALLILDDAVVVLDYKRGPPRHTASYEAQLRLYALAAHEMTSGTLPVRAGLWFLRRGRAGPALVDVGLPELSLLRSDLAVAAREVAGRDARRALFPGIELRRCRAIDCGYLSRCHGASSGASLG